MRSNAANLFVLLSAALSGCYPVEQAALVYSSSHQIGVGVVAGTPENPGLMLNVGYRGLNAAYVPVAVARHCPRGSENECTDISYRLLRLAGRNHEGYFSSSSGATIDGLQVRVSSLESRHELLTQAITGDERLIERIQGAPDRIQTLDAEVNRLRQLSGVSALTDPDSARLANASAEVLQLRALEGRAVVDQRLVSNRQELQRVQRSLAEDRRRLETLMRARDTRNSDRIDDAFSVFGSFNGTAQGGANTASLNAGQIFSTGVAAQHLTRGMRSAAVATACLHAVRDLAPHVSEGARDAFVRDSLNVCRRGIDPAFLGHE